MKTKFLWEGRYKEVLKMEDGDTTQTTLWLKIPQWNLMLYTNSKLLFRVMLIKLIFKTQGKSVESTMESFVSIFVNLDKYLKSSERDKLQTHSKRRWEDEGDAEWVAENLSWENPSPGGFILECPQHLRKSNH